MPKVKSNWMHLGLRLLDLNESDSTLSNQTKQTCLEHHKGIDTQSCIS